MSLEKKVYNGLKKGKRPNIIDEEDLLYIDVHNKKEWESLVMKELEEEDYIPTEQDPDMEIINSDIWDEIEKEDTDENSKNRNG